MTLDIEIELDGVDELEGPIEIKLTGPYDSREEGKIPSVDWDITVQAQNQSFNANLTSTGERAFVGFQGTDYEVSQADRRPAQPAARRERGAGGRAGPLGIRRDRARLGRRREEEGDEDVAGRRDHPRLRELDVTKVLEDLNTVVQEAAKLGGQVGQQAPPALTDEQKDQIEDVVQDPSFDVYVGNDDDKLHRLSADLEFDVPEDSRDLVGGLEGGRISFSIEFANIGSPRSRSRRPRTRGRSASSPSNCKACSAARSAHRRRAGAARRSRRRRPSRRSRRRTRTA